MRYPRLYYSNRVGKPASAFLARKSRFESWRHQFGLPGLRVGQPQSVDKHQDDPDVFWHSADILSNSTEFAP